MKLIPKYERKSKKTARLYKQYRSVMYTTAYDILQDKQLAEDALGEAFLRVIKNLHKINEKNCPRTRNYLVTIIRNVSIDMAKKNAPIYASDAKILSEVADIDNTLDIVIARETKAELKKTIMELKPIYRDVYIMREAYGHSVNEIAQMLNINAETVKKRLTRAKKMIAEKMERRD